MLKLFENPVPRQGRKAPQTYGDDGNHLLVKVEDGLPRKLFPIEAVECLISEDEAKLLAVDYGESLSQGVMEAYAIRQVGAKDERQSNPHQAGQQGGPGDVKEHTRR